MSAHDERENERNEQLVDAETAYYAARNVALVSALTAADMEILERHWQTIHPLFTTLDLLRADLAAAEQRLADVLALVGACGEAMIAGSNTIINLVDALHMCGDPDDPLVRAAMREQEVVQGQLVTLGLRARALAATHERAALSAPATQPDERAAAEQEPYDTDATPAYCECLLCGETATGPDKRDANRRDIRHRETCAIVRARVLVARMGGE